MNEPAFPFSETDAPVMSVRRRDVEMMSVPRVMLQRRRPQREGDDAPEMSRSLFIQTMEAKSLCSCPEEKNKETKKNLSLRSNEDPCRFGLRKAVVDGLFAGVNTITINGGSIYTAREISVQFEKYKETKKNLSLRSNEDLCRLVLRKAVVDCLFAGVNTIRINDGGREMSVQSEKLRWVRCLKELVHVLAVTGDGTNDAPHALKEADTTAPSSSTPLVPRETFGTMTTNPYEAVVDCLFAGVNTITINDGGREMSVQFEKLRWVRCLKELVHVLAVTGDGTNDAPHALKEADTTAPSSSTPLVPRETSGTMPTNPCGHGQTSVTQSLSLRSNEDLCRLVLRKAVVDCLFAGVKTITGNRGREMSVQLEKLRWVRCLKELVHVLAVTGDGTNDAPHALKEADTTAPSSSTPLVPRETSGTMTTNPCGHGQTSVTQRLPRRPGPGSIGERKMIRSNYFVVTIESDNSDLQELIMFISDDCQEKLMPSLLMMHKLLKKIASQSYSISGKFYFGLPSEGTKKPDGDMGIEYSKGLFRALRMTQDGLHLNADVITKCCYESINLIAFVGKYLNIRHLGRELTKEEHAKLEKALTSLKVELTYLSFPKKAQIEGISGDPIRLLRFKSKKTGTEVKVTDYFTRRYSLKVEYPHLPAIRLESDAYVPMEFCQIVSGQTYTEGLNKEQADAFRKASLQRPERRESTIQSMVMIDKKHALRLVNKELNGVMTVSDQLTSVEARVLPPPMLTYRNKHNDEEQTVTPELGKWSMYGKKMFNGARVSHWACVNFSTLGTGSAETFCRELLWECSNLGMTCRKDPVFPIISYQPEKIEEALREIPQKEANIQILIVILPDKTGSYGKIKKICETELGIVSQCIQKNKAFKRQKCCMKSLALKINLKAGGRNYVLQKQIPLITKEATIIFGADVTHPTVAGQAGQLSLAAVVASMDWPEITTYRALVSAQTGRQEIIQDLYNKSEGGSHTGVIRDHLLAFYKKTGGKKPQRIIFFRDGVGETQFEQVLRLELQAIRQACLSLADYKPTITFVVVQKRHHTRFFPTQADMTDKTGNVLPGTVVDTVICHPYEFDFYLNSHAGVLGTNRPVHYHVLSDENEFSSDDLQSLTNSLCYTFAKTTRSVSLVTPVYYAHLAAFRARYYMEGEMPALHLPAIKDNVKDKMFFC